MSIFTVNTPVLYLSCNTVCKKNVIQFNEEKDNGNPIDTSLVFFRKWYGLIALFG
jgi:hypothetical protein